MKLLNARSGPRRFLGVLSDGGVLDVEAAARKAGGPFRPLSGLTSIEQLLLQPASTRGLVRRLAQDPDRWKKAGLLKPEGRIKVLPPIERPSKVFGIGLNYLDHCKEQNIEPPKAPLVFAKFASSIVGPGEPIVWNPETSQQVDWEAELAFVVGRKARNVPESKAMSYLAGYSTANDVTARDLQRSEKQWPRAKGHDTFCPLGPYLVTTDEIENLNDLAIRCRVNGTTMQDSSTKHLIFRIPALVAFLTRTFTLWPGDVVLTGTPAGVGTFRNPPIYLQDGDIVEVEVEGMGVLRNPCRTSPAG